MLISSEHDILTARQKGRWLAEQVGFRGSDAILLSTMVSGLARNVLSSAEQGCILLRTIEHGAARGICIEMTEHGRHPLRVIDRRRPDAGPSRAVSSLRRMAARRTIVDEFEIHFTGRNGSQVSVVKWVPLPVDEPAMAWSGGMEMSTRKEAMEGWRMRETMRPL